MARIKEHLLTEKDGYTKDPGHYRKIVMMANDLMKELQTFPKFGADDKIFEIKAKRLEDKLYKLTREMTKEGKVRRA